MPVGTGQVLVATVTVLTVVGVMFEAGRRVGRGAAEREGTQTDVDALESQMDRQFDRLDDRLRRNRRVREAEHNVVLEWLAEITDAMQEEGYDVEPPEGVKGGYEIDTDIDLEGGD